MRSLAVRRITTMTMADAQGMRRGRASSRMQSSSLTCITNFNTRPCSRMTVGLIPLIIFLSASSSPTCSTSPTMPSCHPSIPMADKGIILRQMLVRHKAYELLLSGWCKVLRASSLRRGCLSYAVPMIMSVRRFESIRIGRSTIPTLNPNNNENIYINPTDCTCGIHRWLYFEPRQTDRSDRDRCHR